MSRLNAILEEIDEQTSGFGITTDCGSSLRSNCDSPLHRGDTFSTALTNFSNSSTSMGNGDVFFTPNFYLKGSSIRSKSRKKSRHYFENTPRFKRMRKVFSFNRRNPAIQEYYENHFLSTIDEENTDSSAFHYQQFSATMQKHSGNRFLCCCGNSVRYLILILSFSITASLFANLMLFNLVAVYYEDLLMPAHFRSNNVVGGGFLSRSLPNANYSSSQPLPYVNNQLAIAHHSTKSLRNKREIVGFNDRLEVKKKIPKVLNVEDFSRNTNYSYNVARSRSIRKSDDVTLNNRSMTTPVGVTKSLQGGNNATTLNRSSGITTTTAVQTSGPFVEDEDDSSPASNVTTGRVGGIAGTLNGPLESEGINKTSLNSPKTAPVTRPSTTRKQKTVAFGSPVHDEDDRIERLGVLYSSGGTVDGNSMAKKSRIEMDDKAANDEGGQEQLRGKNDESSGYEKKKPVDNDSAFNLSLSRKSVVAPIVHNPTNEYPSFSSSVVSEPVDHGRDYVDALVQSLAYGAAGLGILVGHFPAGTALRRFGARNCVAIALLISGFLTAGFPFLAKYGFWAIVGLRFLMGVCFAPALTLIGMTATNWATLKEQLLFVISSFIAIQLAVILSWRSALSVLDLSAQSLYQVFAGHAALSGILLIVWVALYRDTPLKHRFVNGLELNRIMTGRVISQNNRLQESISAILMKSVSTWVIWIASFGYFFAFSVLVNFLPVYMLKVLKQPVDTTIAIPFILLLVTHFVIYLLTKLCASSTIKVRILNTLALVFTSIGFIALAVWPPTDYFAQRTFWVLWLVLSPLGLSTAGFIESAVVYGRYFSQFIVSNLQVSFGLALFMAPIMVFLITVDSSIRYWRLVFLGVSVVLMLAAAVFALLGRGQPSSWARGSWDPNASYRMQSLAPISAGDDCGVLEMRTIDEYLSGGCAADPLFPTRSDCGGYVAGSGGYGGVQSSLFSDFPTTSLASESVRNNDF